MLNLIEKLVSLNTIFTAQLETQYSINLRYFNFNCFEFDEVAYCKVNNNEWASLYTYHAVIKDTIDDSTEAASK